jgi:hypothetical protein
MCWSADTLDGASLRRRARIKAARDAQTQQAAIHPPRQAADALEWAVQFLFQMGLFIFSTFVPAAAVKS